MEKAIEYMAQWSDTYNVGMIKILSQKYRGYDFNQGKPFMHGSVMLSSVSYPSIGMGANAIALYVRGLDYTRDNDTLVFNGTKDNFNEIQKAIEAYNLQKAKEMQPVDNLAFHKAVWEKLAGDPTLVKIEVVTSICQQAHVPMPKNDCFLCEEAYQDDHVDCSKCKGNWGTQYDDNIEATCLRRGSYYNMWCRETDLALKSALAMRIANNTNSNTNNVTPEELELAFQKGLVAAVKAHRTRTGMGLKESKDMVEKAVEKDGRPYICGGYKGSECIAEELAMARSGCIMSAIQMYMKRTGKSFPVAMLIVNNWIK